MVLQEIYKVALGLIISVFAEIAVSTLFQEPSCLWGCCATTSDERSGERAEQARLQRDRLDAYYVVHTIASISIATLLLAASLLMSPRFAVLGDGILLGGIFTLLYGAGIGITRSGPAAKLIVATISLAIALTLGYLRFVPR